MALNFKSRGTEKTNVPSKRPITFRLWEMKLLLIIANYKYAKILKSAILDIKLWLKGDNILY